MMTYEHDALKKLVLLVLLNKGSENMHSKNIIYYTLIKNKQLKKWI